MVVRAGIAELVYGVADCEAVCARMCPCELLESGALSVGRDSLPPRFLERYHAVDQVLDALDLGRVVVGVLYACGERLPVPIDVQELVVVVAASDDAAELCEGEYGTWHPIGCRRLWQPSKYQPIGA